MTIRIYGHPFVSFAWKAIIAAYERDVPFEFCMVDSQRQVTQSNSVIEYLDRFGSAAPMIPVDRHGAA